MEEYFKAFTLAGERSEVYRFPPLRRAADLVAVEVFQKSGIVDVKDAFAGELWLQIGAPRQERERTVWRVKRHPVAADAITQVELINSTPVEATGLLKVRFDLPRQN